MAVMQKKKLCWNCEGSVSLSEETCPYCGVSVIPASLDGSINVHTPPYQMETVQEHSIPRPLYHSEEAQEVNSEKNNENEFTEEQEVSVDEFKNVLFSLSLLLAGSMFFLFGLTLMLFSHKGVFTLQWNANYWFVYSLLSIPLLFLGWKILLKLDKDS